MSHPPPSCFCGSALSAPSLDAGDYVVITRCPACGYWHTSYCDTPDRLRLQEQHPSAYQGEGGNAQRFGTLISAIRAWSARFRASHALLGAAGPTQVIDFGCGQGYFLDALPTTGHYCRALRSATPPLARP
jgi:hypothetical protein